MTAAAPLGLPTAFQMAEVDYVAILPFLIVLGAAVIGVVIEAFTPRERRFITQTTLAVLALLAWWAWNTL